MKIVHERPFSYEFTCRGCKSQLVAETEDVQVGYFGANYGGDSPEREYCVTCPICGTDHIIERSRTTPNVRANADRKEKK